jgi:hypothetical protein
LYLDVTDPNGIQLSALDEAIGFDANALQIGDVRLAPTLAGIGSYSTLSTMDNGSGVLLVGQAFMGSGLPPVLAYGTDIPVLQFNVTLNADAAVGAETGLTLLQDGTINGQTKYTAISDNDGALTWTPGKAPSNSGNAAIDGSVTVVSLSDAAPASVDTATQPSAAVQPKVMFPVRRVLPVSQAVPTSVTIGIPAVPLVGGVGFMEEATVVTSVSPLLPVVGEVSGITAPVPVSAGETLPGVTSASKLADPGASLSLAAVGRNTLAPLGTSSGKTSTGVLDEVYRQMTILGASAVNGINLDAGGDDSVDELADVWGLEGLLTDD